MKQAFLTLKELCLSQFKHRMQTSLSFLHSLLSCYLSLGLLLAPLWGNIVVDPSSPSAAPSLDIV